MELGKLIAIASAAFCRGHGPLSSTMSLTKFLNSPRQETNGHRSWAVPAVVLTSV